LNKALFGTVRSAKHPSQNVTLVTFHAQTTLLQKPAPVPLASE
jgi:hypothetical protein